MALLGTTAVAEFVLHHSICGMKWRRSFRTRNDCEFCSIATERGTETERAACHTGCVCTNSWAIEAAQCITHGGDLIYLCPVKQALGIFAHSYLKRRYRASVVLFTRLHTVVYLPCLSHLDDADE